MRLLVVHRDATPPARSGYTRWHFLGRELVRRGHEVTIIASAICHRAKRQHTSLESETVDGVSYRWLRGVAYSGHDLRRIVDMMWFGRQVARLRSADLPRPDVIIGSSPPPFAALGAARLARSIGVPLILEIRDLWPQTLIDIGAFSPWHPFVLLLERIERHLYSTAQLILALQPLARLHVREKGRIDIDNLHPLPHGVDLAHFPVPAPPPPCDAFVVMYAGSHGIINALEHVVEAARLLERDPEAQHVRFRLIGEGTEKQALMRRAEGLRNVAFEPAVDGRKIPSVLAEADAFVISTRDSPLYQYGTAMNKFADYMAAARPVVIGVGRGVYTPMEDAGSAITVPPEKAVDMAAAIKRLAMMSPEERWQMALRGRRFVEERLTVERLVDRLESMVQPVLGSWASASLLPVTARSQPSSRRRGAHP